MDEGDIRPELEGIYQTVRTAFEQYDMDAAMKYLSVPEGTPKPSRAQASAMAEFLPKLAECRFIRLDTREDGAAYYTESGLDDPEHSEVTVIRFTKGAAGWCLAPAPYTMNAFSGEKTDEAGLEKMIEEQESLAVFPEGAAQDAPPPADPGGADPVGDDRKDEDVRKELETLWARLRTALIEGDVEAAKADMILTDQQRQLTVEDARRFGSGLEDLSECRFLELGWRRDKPQICGYYTEADVDDPERSTIVMIVFGYRDGRWWFVPGPASIEEVRVDKTDREGLLKEIESNPDLRL